MSPSKATNNCSAIDQVKILLIHAVLGGQTLREDAWRFIMQATQNKAFTHQAKLHHYPMGVIVQYILLSVTVAIMQTIKPSRHVFALKPKK